MILAGELQFYQLHEKLTVKNKLRLGREPMPPRYYLGDATNWASKPHVMSEENFGRFIFFLEKTYAFCNEINQIEPWQTQVS